MINRAYFLFLMLAVVSCDYSDVEQYTERKEITLQGNIDSIYADSVSRYALDFLIPGVRYGVPLEVTLKTDWGTWSNKKDTISIMVPFDKDSDSYRCNQELSSARTATDFTIEITAPNMLKSFDLKANALLPDTIQLIPDSLEMKNKPGNRSRIRVLLYARSGRPSYGLKFNFVCNQGITLDPLKTYYANETLQTTMIIPAEFSGDKITVSGFVEGMSEDSKIIPAIIKLK